MGRLCRRLFARAVRLCTEYPAALWRTKAQELEHDAARVRFGILLPVVGTPLDSALADMLSYNL